MKRIDATVWTSDEHDANIVGDRTWITIRIGDHEILVNVNRWELDEAMEDLEDEKESQLILIKEKTIKVADNRKQWITMWRNENGQYCIGRIGFGGMRIVWRKGQKSYIEKMWENYA